VGDLQSIPAFVEERGIDLPVSVILVPRPYTSGEKST